MNAASTERLAVLRQKQDEGEPFDLRELFELELLEDDHNDNEIHEDDLLVLDIIHKKHRGDELTDEDLDELDHFTRARLDVLTQNELADMYDMQDEGESIDEDRLYELELFEKRRAEEELNEDEEYEVVLFERRMLGEELQDDELDELDMLREERQRLALDDEENGVDDEEDGNAGIEDGVNTEGADEEGEGDSKSDDGAGAIHIEELGELEELRSRRDRGESYDTELLYELELFERADAGEDLTDDELFEIDCFERRRQGEDLDEDDLDDLELLRQGRAESAPDDGINDGDGDDGSTMSAKDIASDDDDNNNESDQSQSFRLADDGENGDDSENLQKDTAHVSVLSQEYDSQESEEYHETQNDQSSKDFGDDQSELSIGASDHDISDSGPPIIQQLEEPPDPGELRQEEVQDASIDTHPKTQVALQLNGDSSTNLKSSQELENDILEEITTLKQQLSDGHDIDHDALYEAQLILKHLRDDDLDEDELYEVDLFQRRREGEDLADEDLEELEMLRMEREERRAAQRATEQLLEATAKQALETDEARDLVDGIDDASSDGEGFDGSSHVDGVSIDEGTDSGGVDADADIDMDMDLDMREGVDDGRKCDPDDSSHGGSIEAPVDEIDGIVEEDSESNASQTYDDSHNHSGLGITGTKIHRNINGDSGTSDIGADADAHETEPSGAFAAFDDNPDTTPATDSDDSGRNESDDGSSADNNSRNSSTNSNPIDSEADGAFDDFGRDPDTYTSVTDANASQETFDNHRNDICGVDSDSREGDASGASEDFGDSLEATPAPINDALVDEGASRSDAGDFQQREGYEGESFGAFEDFDESPGTDIITDVIREDTVANESGSSSSATSTPDQRQVETSKAVEDLGHVPATNITNDDTHEANIANSDVSSSEDSNPHEGEVIGAFGNFGDAHVANVTAVDNADVSDSRNITDSNPGDPGDSETFGALGAFDDFDVVPETITAIDDAISGTFEDNLGNGNSSHSSIGSNPPQREAFGSFEDFADADVANTSTTDNDHGSEDSNTEKSTAESSQPEGEASEAFEDFDDVPETAATIDDADALDVRDSTNSNPDDSEAFSAFGTFQDFGGRTETSVHCDDNSPEDSDMKTSTTGSNPREVEAFGAFKDFGDAPEPTNATIDGENAAQDSNSPESHPHQEKEDFGAFKDFGARPETNGTAEGNAPGDSTSNNSCSDKEADAISTEGIENAATPTFDRDPNLTNGEVSSVQSAANQDDREIDNNPIKDGENISETDACVNQTIEVPEAVASKIVIDPINGNDYGDDEISDKGNDGNDVESNSSTGTSNHPEDESADSNGDFIERSAHTPVGAVTNGSDDVHDSDNNSELGNSTASSGSTYSSAEQALDSPIPAANAIDTPNKREDDSCSATSSDDNAGVSQSFAPDLLMAPAKGEANSIGSVDEDAWNSLKPDGASTKHDRTLTSHDATAETLEVGTDINGSEVDSVGGDIIIGTKDDSQRSLSSNGAADLRNDTIEENIAAETNTNAVDVDVGSESEHSFETMDASADNKNERGFDSAQDASVDSAGDPTPEDVPSAISGKLIDDGSDDGNGKTDGDATQSEESNTYLINVPGDSSHEGTVAKVLEEADDKNGTSNQDSSTDGDGEDDEDDEVDENDNIVNINASSMDRNSHHDSDAEQSDMPNVDIVGCFEDLAPTAVRDVATDENNDDALGHESDSIPPTSIQEEMAEETTDHDIDINDKPDTTTTQAHSHDETNDDADDAADDIAHAETGAVTPEWINTLKDLRSQQQQGHNINLPDLFELELLEDDHNGNDMHEDDLIILDIIHKKHNGDDLTDEDLDELDHFTRSKFDVLTQNQLTDLHKMQDAGESMDEDRLYELELFEKRRAGEELNEDEEYEVVLFERRLLGEELQDDELDELDMLREERRGLASTREETDVDVDENEDGNGQADEGSDVNTSDSVNVEDADEEGDRDSNGGEDAINTEEVGELEELRRRRDRGESYDAELLYELELFERADSGEDLTDDEMFELDCFERRQQGEELDDDDLDDLDELREARASQQYPNESSGRGTEGGDSHTEENVVGAKQALLSNSDNGFSESQAGNDDESATNSLSRDGEGHNRETTKNQHAKSQPQNSVDTNEIDQQKDGMSANGFDDVGEFGGFDRPSDSVISDDDRKSGPSNDSSEIQDTIAHANNEEGNQFAKSDRDGNDRPSEHAEDANASAEPGEDQPTNVASKPDGSAEPATDVDAATTSEQPSEVSEADRPSDTSGPSEIEEEEEGEARFTREEPASDECSSSSNSLSATRAQNGIQTKTIDGKDSEHGDPSQAQAIDQKNVQGDQLSSEQPFDDDVSLSSRQSHNTNASPSAASDALNSPMSPNSQQPEDDNSLLSTDTHQESDILKEITTLKQQLSDGHDIDHDALYEAQLILKHLRDEDLDEDELYEVDLFQRRREGEDLADEDLEELEMLRMEREERRAAQRATEQLLELQKEHVDRKATGAEDIPNKNEATRSGDIGGDVTSDVNTNDNSNTDTDTNTNNDTPEWLNTLKDLRSQQEQGHNINLPDLFELELLEDDHSGNDISEDDLIVLDIIHKKHNGDDLTDEDLDELDHFTRSKFDVLTQNQLMDMYDMQDAGESIDEDRLYELELFEKRRAGEELNEDEEYEVVLFERRMLGEELQDDELDELDMLREERHEVALEGKETDVDVNEAENENENSGKDDQGQGHVEAQNDETNLDRNGKDEHINEDHIDASKPRPKEQEQPANRPKEEAEGQPDQPGHHHKASTSDGADQAKVKASPQPPLPAESAENVPEDVQANSPQDPPEAPTQDAPQADQPTTGKPWFSRFGWRKKESGASSDQQEQPSQRNAGEGAEQEDLPHRSNPAEDDDNTDHDDALDDDELQARVEAEVVTLRYQLDDGYEIDHAALYEAELIQKHFRGDDLDEDQLIEVDLFKRRRRGEVLSESEIEDLEMLQMEREEKLAAQQEIERLLQMQKQESGDPVGNGDGDGIGDNDTGGDTASVDANDDVAGADDSPTNATTDIELINTADDDTDADAAPPAWINTLKDLRLQQQQGHNINLPDLFELELLEDDHNGNDMHEDDLIILDIIHKKHNGDELTDEDLDELDHFTRSKFDVLTQNQLTDLHKMQDAGESMDEDRLYELELFEKRRAGEELNEDEEYEVVLFERRLLGEELQDDELDELDLLRDERRQLALDAKTLKDLIKCRDRGEQYDADALYELELFERARAGDELSDDELFELDCFERRKRGEELGEDEIEDLELLKDERLSKNAPQQPVVQPIDSVASQPKSKETHDDTAQSKSPIKPTKKSAAKSGTKPSKRHTNSKATSQGGHTETEDREAPKIESSKPPDEKASDDDVALTRAATIEEDDNIKGAKDLETASSQQSQREDKRGKKKKNKKDRKEKKPKKMRRKVKKPPPVSSTGEAELDASEKKDEVVFTNLPSSLSETTEPPVRSSNQSVAPSASVSVSMSVRNSDPAKRGWFGFGRGKSKKEIELEKARKLQEDLIKEQLKAMEMDNEIKKMEEEQKKQEELVQETIEKKLQDEMMNDSSSWETDTEWEGDDSDESLSSSSGYSSNSDSDAEGSVSSKEDLEVRSQSTAASAIDRASTSSSKASKGKKHRSSRRSNGSNGGRKAPRSKSISSHASRASSTSKKSRGGKGKSGDKRTSSKSNDKRRQPPRSTSSSKSLKGAKRKTISKSKSSSSSSSRNKRSDPKNALPDGALSSSESSMQLPHKPADPSGRSVTVRGKHLSPRKPKTMDLSAHLAAQKRGDDDSDDDVGLTRHGDEMSLGTIDSRKQQATKRRKPKPKPNLNASLLFGESSATLEKPKAHPWESSGKNRASKLGIKGGITEESSERDDDIQDDFFEKNPSFFDRSVFNFNQSFSAQEKTMGAEATIHEEPEEDESSDGNSEVEADFMESLRFDEVEFELMESKVAEKTKGWEADFQEKWETMEADKHVAAQISQRREDRQRTKVDQKNMTKTGAEEFPRLFLFEGEKKDKKRKKRSKRRRRKLDSKFSKEFRRAMQDVFDEEPEEAYEANFSSDGGSIIMDSDAEDDNSDGLNSDEESAALSVVSGLSGVSDGFDDELFRLKARSMQKEGKLKAAVEQSKAKNKSGQANAGDTDGSASDDSLEANLRRAQMERRRNTKSSKHGSYRRPNSGSHRRRHRSRGMPDPTKVYNDEVKKQKSKKLFSVFELKKEMEDLKKNGFQDFHQQPLQPNTSFAAPNPSGKTNFQSTQRQFGQEQAPGASFANSGPRPMTAAEALEKVQNKGGDFVLDRQNSVRTTATNASDLGLLSGRRRFGADGGGLAAGAEPTIMEGDEDDNGDNTDSNNDGGTSNGPASFFGLSTSLRGNKQPMLSKFGTSDLPPIGENDNTSDTAGMLGSSFNKPGLSSSDDMDNFSGSGAEGKKSSSRKGFGLSMKPDISKIGRNTRKFFGKIKLKGGSRNRSSYSDGGGGMGMKLDGDNDDDMGLLG